VEGSSAGGRRNADERLMVNSWRDTNAVLGTKQEQIRVNRAFKQALEPKGGKPIHPPGTTELF
ncbi:MAG: hypothetical protein WBD71_08330, partial [Xanthobacteraceae bacterium]